MYQIENSLSYSINPKRAKRKSHRLEKQSVNRRERRKMRQSNSYTPRYKQYKGWEW